MSRTATTPDQLSGDLPATASLLPDNRSTGLRILYHFRSRGTGAEAVHIAGIAGAFQRMGHEVLFESPTGANPLETRGQSPFKSGRAGWISRLVDLCPGVLFELLEVAYNAVAARRIQHGFGEKKVDLFYERHAFFLWRTSVTARRHGVPMILEVNELVGDERIRAQPVLSGLARWSDRIAFRNATLIAVVSPHLKRRIVAMGVPEEKIVIVPNAVDEPEYASSADGIQVRRQRGLEADAILIGFVGWFVAWHQLDRLIECFAAVAKEFSTARLILVGDGELEASLRALSASLGIGDRVLFVGTVPHREIPELLAAMDVCVVPQSNPYRSPIKLFEYMATGKAVVAPRTEPIEMVARDGEHAVLFDPDCADDLTGALRRMLGDAPLREQLGRAAREHVLHHHTWQRNAELMLDLLPQPLTRQPS